METQAASEVAAPATAQPMSLPARLAGIFYNPSAVVESINIRPAWVVVLILLSIFGMVVQFTVVHRIGAENIILQGMKMNPMAGQRTDAELQEMAAESAKGGAVMLYVSPLFVYWIFIPLLAGLLYLLAVMFGAEIPYKKFLSLLSHSYWMYGLATSVVLLAVVFLASDPATIDLQNAVQANLGVVFEKADHPVLHSLGASLDLFTFWHLAIIALGISILTRRRWSWGKSLLLPGVLWALYVAAKAIVAFAFAK
ncbi:MAG TPA: hypothetical protein VGL91_03585 [Acidobacteriota bacterium]|jgi:hypothetical protein